MNIKFASKEVVERYQKRAIETRGMQNSLENIICRFLQWGGENTIEIYNDGWGNTDFCFQEIAPDGSRGLCGGIIFHGRHDNGGDGSAPSFAVCLTPCDGYAIHT